MKPTMLITAAKYVCCRFAAVLLLLTLPVAAVNPPSDDEKDPKECENDAPTNESFRWSLRLGRAASKIPQSLLALSQVASTSNGVVADFATRLGDEFSEDPLQTQDVRIRMNLVRISKDVFNPTCLFFESNAAFEVLTKSTSTGVGTTGLFPHQVLTDDSFTLINVLPSPEIGWRLRIWKRNTATLVKPNNGSGYYLTTGFEATTPLKDIKFKSPTNPASNNAVLYFSKEATGVGGVHSTTQETVQVLDGLNRPVTLTSKIFAGEGTTGSLLRQENLTYSERNPLPVLANTFYLAPQLPSNFGSISLNGTNPGIDIPAVYSVNPASGGTAIYDGVTGLPTSYLIRPARAAGNISPPTPESGIPSYFSVSEWKSIPQLSALSTTLPTTYPISPVTVSIFSSEENASEYALKWDYTIVREVFTASVDAAGTIGALTLTAKSRENYDDYSRRGPDRYRIYTKPLGPGETEGLNQTYLIELPFDGGKRGMKRLASRTDAFNLPGQSPQTTTYTYINDHSNPRTHGRLYATTYPDGSWKSSGYSISDSAPVAITSQYSSWKDLPRTDFANARLTTTTVTATESLAESYIGTQLVSKSKMTLNNGLSYADTLNTQQQWNGSVWHTTTTAYFSNILTSVEVGRIRWVENSDGTAATYSYATIDGNLVVTARRGAGTRLGITVGTQVITTLSLGNIPIAQITKDIASNLITEQWDTDLTYNGGFDAMGRPIKRIYNGDVNDYDITQYACCGLEFTRDRMGASTRYFRDGLKRVYKMETKASDTSAIVRTFTTVSGLTRTRTRTFSDGQFSLFLGSATGSIDGLTKTITEPSKNTVGPEDAGPPPASPSAIQRALSPPPLRQMARRSLRRLT